MGTVWWSCGLCEPAPPWWLFMSTNFLRAVVLTRTWFIICVSYSFYFCGKIPGKRDVRKEGRSRLTVLGDRVCHGAEAWRQEQNGADHAVSTVRKQKAINEAAQFSFFPFYSFWDASSWNAATNIQDLPTSDKPFSEVHSWSWPSGLSPRWF